MAGKDLRALHPSAIKVDITVTLQLLKSLSLVSGNTRRVRVLLGPAGRIAILSPPPSTFFGLFLLLEVLPTCVIVWPLSACLLQSAVLQQPSPPPSISHARSLPPCGPLQTSSSSFSFSSQEQLLQNWLATLYWIYYSLLLLLLHQSLSATSTSTLSSRLSPARITLSGDGVDWCFVLLYFPLLFFLLFFLLELLVCILILFCCEKFADIVAVIMNDCYIWWFHGFYAVFILFPVPPTAAASKAEPACSLEVRLSRVNHWGKEGGRGFRIEESNQDEKDGGGGVV